jgi:hypothetical protein
MKRALSVFVFSTLSAASVSVMAQSGRTASIEQQGSLGTATIQQDIDNGPNDISILQGAGAGNSAAIQQLDSMYVVSSIEQSGHRQTAQAWQWVDGGRLQLRQGGGSDNLIDVRQAGASVDLNVRQLGTRNAARLTQDGRGVSADVAQSGTGNAVAIDQIGDFGKATVEQSGTNNRATLGADPDSFFEMRVTQRGADNVATIQANLTLASIEQDGSGHVASILSTGPDATAAIRQGGRDNLAAILQQTGGTASISQNTLRAGYGNVASIVQR